MKKALISLVSVGLMFGTAMGQSSPQPQCNPSQIDQALVENDLDSALKLNEACIVRNRTDLETFENKYRGQPSGLVDVVGLAEVNLGSHLIAKVEILALKGALNQAESALTDAEQFDHQHPRAGLSWTMGGLPLARARAFIMEKKGDLTGAAKIYEDILAAQKRDGWRDDIHGIRGRLAIIALMKNDGAAVELWSKDALSVDPAANAARGELLQRKGDKPAARQYYAAALKLMNDAAKAKNWTLPIYFAEFKQAQDGLVR
jgi:tetratricopeptide (TPR) repeat protein